VERTFAQHKLKPTDIGVIVVSGDIADHGPDQNRYADALDFFNRLFAMTGLSSKHLVITPGNHDVTRHVIEAGEATFDFSQRQYDDRVRRTEEPYRQFCDALFGTPTEISRLRRFKTSVGELNFLQLNSTLPRDQYTKEYGFLGLAPLRPLEDLGSLYQEARSRGDVAVNIAVQHHHVISTVKAEHVPEPKASEIHDPVSTMVDQSNLVDWCAQYKVRLLMHGHQHKLKCRVIGDRFLTPEGLFVTDVIGAGTAGASWRADGERMSFNLYDVGPERIRFRAFAMDREMTWSSPLRDLELPTSGWMVPQ
jgi:3',5'-cyclic AMP phosphodiesterase CpdA